MPTDCKRHIYTLSPSISPQLAQQNGLHDLESPLRARWVLRVIVLGLLVLFVWAAIGKIDQVTRAQAVLIAADRTQLVQSPDGGVLTELHVKEGQIVKAGQLLATLQKQRAEAAVSDIRSINLAIVSEARSKLSWKFMSQSLKYESAFFLLALGSLGCTSLMSGESLEGVECCRFEVIVMPQQLLKD